MRVILTIFNHRDSVGSDPSEWGRESEDSLFYCISEQGSGDPLRPSELPKDAISVLLKNTN